MFVFPLWDIGSNSEGWGYFTQTNAITFLAVKKVRFYYNSVVLDTNQVEIALGPVEFLLNRFSSQVTQTYSQNFFSLSAKHREAAFLHSVRYGPLLGIFSCND